jgi:hypothetical protein
MTPYDDGSGGGEQLIVGGSFTSAGDQAALCIARWNGRSFLPLDAGLNGPVSALKSVQDGSGSPPSLYAGGNFNASADLPLSAIARWDGASWNALGSGAGWPHGVATFEIFEQDGLPQLFTGGGFLSMGGHSDAAISSWALCALASPADINHDGHVNVDDLLLVILAWGPCPSTCPADINHDGTVNVDDLLLVITQWRP